MRQETQGRLGLALRVGGTGFSCSAERSEGPLRFTLGSVVEQTAAIAEHEPWLNQTESTPLPTPG